MRILDSLWNKLWMKYYKVSLGRNFRCEGRIVLQGHGKYSIGDDVHIISKEFVNPIGGNRTVLQTFGNGEIVIGNNVGISHAILCARSSITIEDNVLLGGGVKVYDTDFHPVEYEARVANVDSKIKSQPVRIKEGAFVGAHALVLKGVTIGKHAVIGAGAVVTKDVPDNEVWGGNPVRFIKKL